MTKREILLKMARGLYTPHYVTTYRRTKNGELIQLSRREIKQDFDVFFEDVTNTQTHCEKDSGSGLILENNPFFDGVTE